ncbi:hypothetical protein MMB75_19560 [Paenibacillus sp. P2(2022)]|nr:MULTISPECIES: hypothetical protein [Paenibacillus]MDG0055868.1 hypothetical protein [Paenibacillus sp. P2(2022)]WOZ37874.1 hypothetical protein RQP19_21490 [Paenibacillus polymyxa]
MGDSGIFDKVIHLCPVIFLGCRNGCLLWQDLMSICKSKAEVKLYTSLGLAKVGPLLPPQAKSNGGRVDNPECFVLCYQTAMPRQNLHSQPLENLLEQVLIHLIMLAA